MSVHRFSCLFIACTLAGGCASFHAASDNPLDSEQVTVATGDDDLKEAVESGDGRDATADERLDTAIAPELRAKARDAREKLDDPGQTDTGALAEEEDLWNRLRHGFALDHDIDNARVQAQLDWYVRHPKYIQRVVERGRRYLYYILSETEKRNLPSEFALLPVVESAFDPFAYSHGRASGLWQFIPSTAKYFGLTQSWWHDDRRDIIASTDAALEYLERLSERFEGDYTLALAAYNSGGGTVSSAIRRNLKANRPTDFWSLELPRETRHYVPKLIALAKIFDHPEAYGLELPPLKNEPYFEVVDTGSQLDLAQAAELAQVDIDEIYLLNPSYNRWATHPDGPHRLLVPREKAEAFRTALANFPVEQRVSWQNYKVRSGDSLITIARRFHSVGDPTGQQTELRPDPGWPATAHSIRHPGRRRLCPERQQPPRAQTGPSAQRPQSSLPGPAGRYLLGYCTGAPGVGTGAGVLERHGPQRPADSGQGAGDLVQVRQRRGAGQHQPARQIHGPESGIPGAQGRLVVCHRQPFFCQRERHRILERAEHLPLSATRAKSGTLRGHS